MVHSAIYQFLALFCFVTGTLGNQICSSNSQCSSMNAVCTSGVCICKPGYDIRYLDDSSVFCVPASNLPDTHEAKRILKRRAAPTPPSPSQLPTPSPTNDLPLWMTIVPVVVPLVLGLSLSLLMTKALGILAERRRKAKAAQATTFIDSPFEVKEDPVATLSYQQDQQDSDPGIANHGFQG